MTFLHPALLLLLWLVPVAALLAVFLRRRADRRAALWAGPAASRAPMRNGIFIAQLALWCTAAALAIVAAARPQWGEVEETVLSRGRNVVLLVDVSRSMLAEDVHPNRLERARVDLRDLLDELEGDRAALVAFRGSAVTICPLTTDTGFLRLSLDHLGIDSAPRGETDLGKALDAALELLSPFSSDHNAIVLVSDGEDLSGTARAAAARAAAASTPVFTVGIGDARGASVPLGDGTPMQYDGSPVVSKLDNETLAAIARTSGGAYIPLRLAGTGGVTLGTLYRDHLRRIAAQDFEERSSRRRIERYQFFLIPAIVLFLLVASLSAGRPVRRRGSSKVRESKVLAVLVLAAVVCVARAEEADTPVSEVPAPSEAAGGAGDGEAPRPSQPADAQRLARDAQTAFREGQYDEAAALFDEAASLAGAPRPAFADTCTYNAALARLRAGDPNAALPTLRSLADRDTAPSATREALAAALFRAAQTQTNATDSAEPDAAAIRNKIALLEESAAAYQTAAQSRSAPEHLRRNLAVATAPLSGLREEAHQAEVLAKYGKSQPQQLATDLLARLRDIRSDAARALTNDSPAQITQFEDLARRQREAADLWIPLRPQLEQAFSSAVTNQESLVKILDDLQKTGDSLVQSANALEDFDPAGVDAVRKCEESALGYFSLLADPRALVAEAIRAQTNTVDAAKAANENRPQSDEQSIAMAMTELFAKTYPAWADQMEQMQQMQQPTDGTPAPEGQETTIPAEDPKTAQEKRAEIERLAAETLEQHKIISDIGANPDKSLPDESLANRVQALSNLLRIQELLPKDPNQNQQQNQQQDQQHNQQQQNQQEQQQDQQQQDQQQNQQDQQQQDQQQEQQDSQQDQQNPEESQDAQESKDPPPDPSEEAARAMLQKILEGEKEREEERRKQQIALPPRIHERDW